MSNLPAPRYSLWQAVSAALATALRALEEVRALSRQPGPPGERGEPGEMGQTGHGGLDGKDGVQGERGLDGKAGRDGQPGVPGRDGEKGLDGKDGLSFDDMDVVYDGQRSIKFMFARGERQKEFVFKMPIVIDRGVWAEKEYEQGDGVTWKGSFWIAQRATSSKPDEINRDWRLAVKRGRDGKDARTVTGAGAV